MGLNCVSCFSFHETLQSKKKKKCMDPRYQPRQSMDNRTTSSSADLISRHKQPTHHQTRWLTDVFLFDANISRQIIRIRRIRSGVTSKETLQITIKFSSANYIRFILQINLLSLLVQRINGILLLTPLLVNKRIILVIMS